MTIMPKIDTLFMTKVAENPTLWDRTYLQSPYMGGTWMQPTGE